MFLISNFKSVSVLKIYYVNYASLLNRIFIPKRINILKFNRTHKTCNGVSIILV